MWKALGMGMLLAGCAKHPASPAPREVTIVEPKATATAPIQAPESEAGANAASRGAIVQVEVVGGHICGLFENHRIRCIEARGLHPAREGVPQPVVVDVESVSHVAGMRGYCAWTEDGQARCWNTTNPAAPAEAPG